MPFVPNTGNPQWEDHTPPEPEHPRSITVYALNENKRPVGFAPWPKQPKAKKKSGKKG